MRTTTQPRNLPAEPSPADLERELGVTRFAQARQRRAGRLPFLRVGARGVRYQRAAVVRWWAENYGPRSATDLRARRTA